MKGKTGAMVREQRQGDRRILKNLNINIYSAVFCRGVCVESVAVAVKRLAAPKLPLHIFCLANRSQTDCSSAYSFTPPKYTNYSGPGLNVSCLKVEKVTDE